jgi:peptide-methionine (S)-S-oxide reductase
VKYEGGYIIDHVRVKHMFHNSSTRPIHDQILHTEVVRVLWDRNAIDFSDLLKLFWECHDPTQGMAQGNDSGSQYRSAIYVNTPELLQRATASRDRYQTLLKAGGRGAITTEIVPCPEFFYAEDYHQQYLAKNPGGYCGIGGTGVSCPIGLAG